MFSWFKRWKETRRLKAQARRIIADPQSSIDALIMAKGIMFGLAERRPICRHCFKMYDPKERSFAEKFQMRSILMIPDSELDPMLCDDCFGTAIAVYNPKVTNVGTSNSGPANLVLQKLG